jgi:DNA-binding MarR family transcriptional regulator
MVVRDPDRLSEDEVAAWDGMLHVHSLVIRAFDELLRAEFDFTIGDFDVVSTLQEAPDGDGLRMSDLAGRVRGSPSRMTRRVEALEELGYVERRPDPDDGRAVRAHITDRGNSLMDSIARSHHALVRAMYLDHVTDAEQRQLGDFWRRMLD